MSNEQFSRYCISGAASLIEAFSAMDAADCKLLIVVRDGGVVEGVLSVGDIQRAILAGNPLTDCLRDHMRQDTRMMHVGESRAGVVKEMRARRLELMPVLDGKQRLVDILHWRDLDSIDHLPERVNAELVVMAGGEGTRLRPLTAVLPKPLVPLGDEAILKTIIDRFARHGIQRAQVTVNYKSRMIEEYVAENIGSIPVKCVREPEFYGTAGALSLIDRPEKSFFVSNCDIVVDLACSDALERHRASDAQLTIVSAAMETNVPYGTLQLGQDGRVESLIEKPALNHLISTGVYLVEPSAVDLIPYGTCFHMTDLAQKILEEGGVVSAFPISDGSWLDVGVWADYPLTQERFVKWLSARG